MELSRVGQLHCNTIADMFRYAVKQGYDIECLAQNLMTSAYGIDVVNEKRMSEYACGTYMLEGIVRACGMCTGVSTQCDEFEAWFIGYLYKYWYETTGIDPRKIYAMAPFKELMASFAFLHTQGWAYCVAHLTDKYNNRVKG